MKRLLLIDEDGTVHNRVVAEDGWTPPAGLRAVDEDGLEDVRLGDRIDPQARKVVGMDGTVTELQARLAQQMDARARLAAAYADLQAGSADPARLSQILADLLVALDLDAR